MPTLGARWQPIWFSPLTIRSHRTCRVVSRTSTGLARSTIGSRRGDGTARSRRPEPSRGGGALEWPYGFWPRFQQAGSRPRVDGQAGASLQGLVAVLADRLDELGVEPGA